MHNKLYLIGLMAFKNSVCSGYAEILRSGTFSYRSSIQMFDFLSTVKIPIMHK
jgi:hypothetical protein